jgi:LysM repeat protein
MTGQRLSQSAHQIFSSSPDGQPRDGEIGKDQAAGIGQVLGSLAVTLLSMGMLLGSFLLSQLDAAGVRPLPTEVAGVSPSPTLFLSATFTPVPYPTESTIAPSVTETGAPLPSASPTSPSPLLPSCSPPAGWVLYTVQPGETLYSLALRTGVTELALMEANCLNTQAISPGQQIYLPPMYVSPTPRPFACGAPLHWVAWYVVQPGDTIFSLSQRFGVSMEAIRLANCLPDYTIYVGSKLFLPPPPPTPVRTSTPLPSYTPTPIPPSPTGTAGPTFTPTATPTEFADTPAPTSTELPVMTATATPTFTATSTVTSPPTQTLPPTSSPTSTPTSTPMPTPTPTGSPAPTPTPTFTSTPPATPTTMPTPAPPFTPTPTLAPTPTPTAPGG